MKIINHLIPRLLAVLVFAAGLSSVHGEDVSIPDPGLNAAIRETLQKAAGPITEQGEFQFAITGPPGIYTVLKSDDLVLWNDLANGSNALGISVFSDPSVPFSSQGFYRVRLQIPGAN